MSQQVVTKPTPERKLPETFNGNELLINGIKAEFT